MPVVFDADNYDLWLDPGMKDAETAAEMLKPYDANAMSCYSISTRINHVANDDEECAARVWSSCRHALASSSHYALVFIARWAAFDSNLSNRTIQIRTSEIFTCRVS
jgi:hypothetical protein